MNHHLTKENIRQAIEKGIDNDWRWDDDGNEYPVDTFNVEVAVNEVMKLLNQEPKPPVGTLRKEGYKTTPE